MRNRLPESSCESQWENHAVVLPLIVSPVRRTGETATHYNLSIPICPTGEGGRIDNSGHLSCGNRMAQRTMGQYSTCIVGKPHGAMRWAFKPF